MGERTNPYVGPRPFTRDELLPAREREILELRRTLISARLLILHSPSGAGKTSLIESANGLRAAMADRQFLVYPSIRVHHLPPPELRGAINRYEFSALRSLAAEEDGELIGLADLGLAGYLGRRNSPAAAPDPADPAADPEDSPAPKARRQRELLIFDQFEEVLTTDPSDVAGRATFFDRLAVVLDDPFRWALFLIREDFLGALAPWAKRLPTHLTAHYRIDLLRPEAARVAIQGPATAQGVRFAADAMEHLIEELCRTTVQQLDGRTASQAGLWVEPVHLQVVCRRLWSQLAADETEVNLATVKSLGDVDASLRAFYSEQVAAVARACGVSERRLRDWISARLISSRGLRLQVIQDDAREVEMSGVLEALESVYIVRGEERRGVRWFELAHDRLVEPVRRDNEVWEQANLHPMQLQARLWQRESERPDFLLSEDALASAATWAAQHAASLTEREEIFLVRSRERSEYRSREQQVSAQLAIEQQRRLLEQFRRVRALRIAAMLLVGLVLGAVGLAVVAWTKSEEARRQKETAVARRNEVDALVKSLAEDVTPRLADTPGTLGLQKELNALLRRTLAERADDVNADPVYLRNRFAQHLNLGRFELAHGSLGAAVIDFQAALSLAEAIERRLPGDPELLRRKAVLLVKLGSAEMGLADFADARVRFMAAMALLERPNSGAQLSEITQRELVVALQKLGELEVEVGDPDAARARFDRSLAIARALAESEPLNVESRRLVFGALLRLGWLAARQDRVTAIDHFRGALEAAETTRALFPLDPRVLRDVSLACDNLGQLEADTSPITARGYFDRSLEIAEVLARAEPRSSKLTYDLFAAHLQFRLLGADAAQDHLPRAREVVERMTALELFTNEDDATEARAILQEWERAPAGPVDRPAKAGRPVVRNIDSSF